MRINLLPQEYRPQPIVNPFRLLLMIIGGILVFVTFGFSFLEYSAIQQNKAELKTIQEQLLVLEGKKEQLKAVEELQQAIQKNKKEIKLVEAYYNLPVSILSSITNALSDHIWLESVQMKNDGIITVKAQTLDFVIISDLLDNLKKVKFFKEEKLVKIDEEKSDELTSYSFEILLDTGRKLEYVKK